MFNKLFNLHHIPTLSANHIKILKNAQTDNQNHINHMNDTDFNEALTKGIQEARKD